MSHWFIYCKNLTALIDFQNLDVSDCEDFYLLPLHVKDKETKKRSCIVIIRIWRRICWIP